MKHTIMICYLCGEPLDVDIDRDHVPPRQFYGKEVRTKHNPNLFTLPVHSLCNKDYQKDEDYFVHTIAPLAMGSYSGKSLWADLSEQYKRPQGQRIGQMVLKEFDKRPSGLILPFGKVAKRFDGQRVWRVVWKIMRGLFLKETGQFPQMGLQGRTIYFHLMNIPLVNLISFVIYPPEDNIQVSLIIDTWNFLKRNFIFGPCCFGIK